MPLYDIHCEEHGWQRDVYEQMRVAMNGIPCPVDVDGQKCGKQTTRDYQSRGEISDNNFRPWWSDQLSDTAEPVYVANAEQARHLMKQKGLARYEAGMEKDGQRVAERTERERIDNFVGGTREEFKRQMNFARRYGRAPDRW